MMAAEKFFPRARSKEKCHPSVPDACCPGRRQAVRRGEIFFDWCLGGWVDIFNPVRSATWEAIYRSEQNHVGEPYLIELCPYCSCELPDLSKFKKAIDCGNSD